MNSSRTNVRRILPITPFVRRAVFALAVVCAGTGHSARLSAADQVIRYSNETTLRGDVKNMTPKDIQVVRSGGETTDVSSDDIRDLRYDGEPPVLQRARSSEQSGALDAAIEKLEEARTSNTSSDPRVAAEIDFLTARCLARTSLRGEEDVADTIRKLDAFRSSHKTNVRYFEATLWSVRLHSKAEQFEPALTLLKELNDSGIPGYQRQSEIARGHVLLKTAKAQEALQAFESALAKIQDDAASAELRRDARVGRALSLHALSKTDVAVMELDDVIRELPDSESAVVARMWIQQGDMLRDIGQERAAVLAYLHVDILYGSESAAHAEALFRLSKLWQTTGHPDRARDASVRLQQSYPKSSWATEAQ